MAALPRANAPARSCLRLFLSSERSFISSSPRQSLALRPPTVQQPSLRTFTTSPTLLKKRKIAPASNSPKSHHEPSPSKDDAPEDPLDMTPVTSAYAPIDAHFRSLLAATLHGGRFNPENLGSLPIPLKDPQPATFPLRELAQIVPRTGRAISLLVHDTAYIKPIMSAVQASREFNQQPQRSEDNELELLLKVELEKKDESVRRVREACQAWRERVRGARAKHEKTLKEWKKSGVVLPDVVKKAEKELQKVQDKKMKEIDQEEAQTVKQL